MLMIYILSVEYVQHTGQIQHHGHAYSIIFASFDENNAVFQNISINLEIFIPNSSLESRKTSGDCEIDVRLMTSKMNKTGILS